MKPEKLIDQLEAIITFRDEGSGFPDEAYRLIDELIKLKPETLTKKEQDRLQYVLDKFENALQDDMTTDE